MPVPAPRNFNGTTQRYRTVGSGVNGSPVQSTPLTLIIDFIPLNTTPQSIPLSLMASAAVGNAFEGWMIIMSGGNISVNACNGGAFNGSGTLPIQQGQRHLVTGVFASATSYTCFVDGFASSTGTTSTIPTHTPDQITVAASQHGGVCDNFCNCNVFYAAVLPYALDFQQHVALWKTGRFVTGGNSGSYNDYSNVVNVYRYDLHYCNNTNNVGQQPLLFSVNSALANNNSPPPLPAFPPYMPFNATAPGGVTASCVSVNPAFSDMLTLSNIAAASFRKTISPLGARKGSRSIQGYMNG